MDVWSAALFGVDPKSRVFADGLPGGTVSIANQQFRTH
jgi:hypothetical protein